jgi:TonB-linked SusC/RagA family outer membrane protein
MTRFPVRDRLSWTRVLRGCLAVALAAAVVTFAPPLAAQGTSAIAGTVVNERNGAPIADAQVAAEGRNIGTTTDAAGRFRLVGLTGSGDLQLTVRRIGFQAQTATATIGATNVRVVMRERAMELSQVVVTGTAGVAEKRAIGNVVTTVNAAEVVATQPVASFQELLNGRASGVSIVASTGQVGSGARIRVRGASSLSLTNDPLIYVDGIRVDNTQASGPSNQGFGSASISRWNDFNPDDIESLEVIKGPAAATLYGTEAANGVIQIITKKGAAGRPVWSVTGRMGSSWLPDFLTRFPDNYGTVPRAGSTTALDTVSISTQQLNDSLNARFGNDIFTSGALQDLQMSVSGGTNTVKYYVGGGYEENRGAERVNRLNRSNIRVNLSANPSPKFDISTSMGYTTGRTYLPYESGGGGAVWGTVFASPTFLYGGVNVPARNANNPQLGFRSGPPNAYYEAYDVFQDADRFTGSFQLTNRPVKFFNHRLILGMDRLAENNEDRTPRNDIIGATYASFSGSGLPTAGSISASTRDVTYTTADYLANLDLSLSSSWRSVTSAGGQLYLRRSRFRSISGTTFPSAGLTSIASAAVRNVGSDEVFENNTVGGFIQQQFGWNDRLFVTAAMRADDNSAFGTNFDIVTYPKLSVSYVLSDEPALHLPSFVNQLRLRTAYGASGLQPGAFDAVRTYGASGGFLTPSSAGNPDLGPETSTELELGLDAGLWNDRYGFEVTYFNGKTKDATLSRQAPPSSGFPGLQFFNAGQVSRRGLEWMVRGAPIRSDNLSLDLTLSGSTNNYTIDDLGGNQVVSLSSNIQHVVGYAPGAWWDRKIVKADYDATTKRATNLMCDDGNGGMVSCATAPRVFLGNSVPTSEGSFSAGLTMLRNLRVNAFVDWRTGYKKLDGNYRVRCGAFVLCRELYYPDEVQDKALLGAVQAGTAYTYHLIDDASFARFRELSVTYTLPSRLATSVRASRASITLAGRNLGLWTNFSGVEPEASFNGGTRGGAFGQWEQSVLPQLRQFVTTVSLNF